MKQKEPSKAYGKVIEYIKKEILGGRLKPGQKLSPERSLAEELGVGRNSVREALRTLDILGVISSTQGAGNYVSCNFEKSMVESLSMMFMMQRTNYEQISELRQALELQAIALAADRIAPAQIGELEKIVSELASSSDESRNVLLDKRLHYMIAQASRNPLILEILQALSHIIDTFISDLRGKILEKDKGRNRLQHIHEEMVRALKAGDADGARRAMSEHFAIIEENLGYFGYDGRDQKNS